MTRERRHTTCPRMLKTSVWRWVPTEHYMQFLEEVRNICYDEIIIQGTPKVLHMDQSMFIIRHVHKMGCWKFSVMERSPFPRNTNWK